MNISTCWQLELLVRDTSAVILCSCANEARSPFGEVGYSANQVGFLPNLLKPNDQSIHSGHGVLSLLPDVLYRVNLVLSLVPCRHSSLVSVSSNGFLYGHYILRAAFHPACHRYYDDGTVHQIPARSRPHHSACRSRLRSLLSSDHSKVEQAGSCRSLCLCFRKLNRS